MMMTTVEVAPGGGSDSLKIPLTYLDLPWLLFTPVKRVFFYRLTDTEHFYSSILPKLKLSLSSVLNYYLPLCGRITWDPNDTKPSIVVSQNDAVSVTIAESDADFSFLSGYGQRPLSELHALLPKLPVSDDSASVFSLQITLFPNHGFSLGVVAHHAVLDGKTSTMFVKAWAHICKNDGVSLPENLTPSHDRSLVRDLYGLDEKMIEMVRSLKNSERSLTPFLAREIGNDVVLATLVLSRDDIEKLRELVKSESPSSSSNLLHLSSFVIAYAYAWTRQVKARGGSKERSVSLLFSVDFRERLDPPLPVNYFGDCIIPTGSYSHKASVFMEEKKGFVKAVEILSDLVRGLSSWNVEMIADKFAESFEFVKESSQFGTVAGSTRLGVYESDFGWGRPVKVDVVSIDQAEAISMTETRDQPGGVEIGMCLKKSEMDLVFSFFNNITFQN